MDTVSRRTGRPGEPRSASPAGDVGAVLREHRVGTSSLTTRGRCLLAGGLATAACAVVLDERDLLRVGVVVALLPLLALALAAAGRRTVRVRRAVTPARVPVGADADVELTVAGRATLGPLELVDTVPDAAGPPPSGPRFSVLPRPSGVPVRYPLRPPLRGAHRIGPLLVRGVDPLGLAEFARTAPGTAPLLVVPRTVALCGLPAAAGADEGSPGSGAARVGPGRSDVLVRPYRSGDELRRVHWRSTARHGELMVRLEERPRHGGVTVLLDRRAGAHRGHGAAASLEWAVELVASACLHLLGHGEPVTLVTEDGGRPGGDSPASPDALLDALATVRPSGRTGLAGPPLPAAGALVVLGATTPEEVAALLVRCPAGGHAVLLAVDGWGSGPPGAAVAPAAAALRSGGFTVTVATPATPVAQVWDALVAPPGAP